MGSEWENGYHLNGNRFDKLDNQLVLLKVLFIVFLPFFLLLTTVVLQLKFGVTKTMFTLLNKPAKTLCKNFLCHSYCIMKIRFLEAGYTANGCGYH